MRKLFILFTCVIMSLSSAVFAQTSLEGDITAEVAESGAAEAYAALISSDSDVLSQDQKDALAALGSEAGIAFLNAIASGSSFNDAAVIAVTTAGASSDIASNLVATLTSSSSGDSTGQVASTGSGEESGDLQTETAAGPGTATGAGTTTPVGSGAGAGGSGGGGVTASGN